MVHSSILYLGVVVDRSPSRRLRARLRSVAPAEAPVGERLSQLSSQFSPNHLPFLSDFQRNLA